MISPLLHMPHPNLAGAWSPLQRASGSTVPPRGWAWAGQRPANNAVCSCDINTFVRSIYRSNVLPGSTDKPDANTIYVKGIPRDAAWEKEKDGDEDENEEWESDDTQG